MPTYTPAKVHNEIELCEINDLESKREIERALLKNRISYYIRWPKTSIFSRRRGVCIICVNENSVTEAEEIVQSVCDQLGVQVRFLMKRFRNEYL